MFDQREVATVNMESNLVIITSGLKVMIGMDVNSMKRVEFFTMIKPNQMILLQNCLLKLSF